MNKKLSVTEYANLRNVSRQTVLKTLKDGRTLEGVVKSEKIGNTYVLVVEKEYYKNLSIQASKALQARKKK